MNNLLSVTSEATKQIKKILSDAPKDIDSVVLGIDKSGCSGYSYKLDLANSKNLENFELIIKDNAKIFIDPKATMFLIGSQWITKLINSLPDLSLKIQIKRVLVGVVSLFQYKLNC